MSGVGRGREGREKGVLPVGLTFRGDCWSFEKHSACLSRGYTFES